MRICHRTHQGKVRASNQDSLLVDERIYGVADGMGGHNGGETASRVAVQVLKNALRRKTPEARALEMGMEAANRRIFDMARHDSALSGMGTTVTFLWENGQEAFICHVGDSRAYLLRDGELKQVTEDHSVVGELLRNGVITAEMARTHPYRNVITRAVGVDPAVTADIFTHDLKENDLWLICSDGLYNMVSDDTMAEILKEAKDEETAAEELLQLALENGGTDNITFVIGRVTEVSAS